MSDPIPHSALDELKVRARLARNAGAPRLRDGLHEAARSAGFADWEHARRVLDGLAAPGDDMGTFWHAPRTGILLNEWFAHLGEARAAHARQPLAFLLPYRRQFMVVQADFIRELVLDPADPLWVEIRRDAVSGHGSPAWRALCAQRIRAPRATFA